MGQRCCALYPIRKTKEERKMYTTLENVFSYPPILEEDEKQTKYYLTLVLGDPELMDPQFINDLETQCKLLDSERFITKLPQRLFPHQPSPFSGQLLSLNGLVLIIIPKSLHVSQDPLNIAMTSRNAAGKQAMTSFITECIFQGLTVDTKSCSFYLKSWKHLQAPCIEIQLKPQMTVCGALAKALHFWLLNCSHSQHNT